MQFVKTQRIFYNNVPRIRLIADNADSEYIRLVRKLPDCRWSNQLNSWHTDAISNHISFLNKVFPSHIRFYDVSSNLVSQNIIEEPSEKRIQIIRSESKNFISMHFLYDRELQQEILKSGGLLDPDNKNTLILQGLCELPENLKAYLEKTNYRVDFESCLSHEKESMEVNVTGIKSDAGFKEFLKFRNYKKRTIEQYLNCIKRFLGSTAKENILSIESIQDYIDEMSIACNFSRSYQNLHINSIKAYFQFQNGYSISKTAIHRPIRIINPPEILSRQEIAQFICRIQNVKHNVLVSMIYLTGLTVNEVISITLNNFDPLKMQIYIPGKNEYPGRTIKIPDDLVKKIEHYIESYHPNKYLFEGYKGKQFSCRSIQKAIKKYSESAEIIHKTTAMTLRHSVAGHKAADGMKMKDLQCFLGHNSLKSTEKYKIYSCNEKISVTHKLSLA